MPATSTLLHLLNRSLVSLTALVVPVSAFAQSAQPGQSQQNNGGNAIQIGTAHDVNISIAPETKAITLPANNKKPVPPKVAAENTWRALLRLSKLQADPTDDQILKTLPKFAQPEDKGDEGHVADEYRDLLPQLKKLALLPKVQDWKEVSAEPLDDKGDTRITFQGILEASPYAYNQFGQLLPPPSVQLLIDMDKDGVPRGFNIKGYSPYAKLTTP